MRHFHLRCAPGSVARRARDAVLGGAAPSTVLSAVPVATPFAAGCAALCAALALPARADSLLSVNNQGALARSFALPQAGRTQVLQRGGDEFALAADWTNEYFADANARESLVLDGETQRYTVSWFHGVADGVEFGVRVPLLVSGGGVLDGFIQNWHALFGLPNGGREQVPHGQYQYRYVRDGRTVLNVDTASAGIGDVELEAGWRLSPTLAWRALAKLPSGDSSRLAGGNAGGALWLDYDPFRAYGGPATRWRGFASAGVSYNERSSVLGAQQQAFVGLAALGAGYRLTPHFTLSAQLDGHSQLYDDSSLKALRREGLQLAIGGIYEPAARWNLRAGFQEDLVTDSSPDISFNLALGWR